MLKFIKGGKYDRTFPTHMKPNWTCQPKKTSKIRFFKTLNIWSIKKFQPNLVVNYAKETNRDREKCKTFQILWVCELEEQCDSFMYSLSFYVMRYASQKAVEVKAIK